MEEATGSALPPPPDRREVIEVSQEEFEDSQRFLQSEDAIMDDSVFLHIRRVISYLYRKATDTAGEGDSSDCISTPELQSEYLAELNTNVLNTLVDSYVGYAWLCEVCARWIEELNVQSDHYLTTSSLGDKIESSNSNSNNNASGTANIVREALMHFLTQKYDSEKMRVYMEDKAGHDKWNPPELYWNLMKSPLVVSNMIKIYRERPKDEFLSSWYQDYINNASTNMKLEQAGLDKEGLSRITSNFSVFTLRMSEEIRKFLLKDDILDSIEVDNTTPLSPLFWHAENAYIYSQALLHFIYQWRIDLRGCRRLSQLVARTTMNPVQGLFPDVGKIDGKLYEWSASQIHLLMTNFARFPNLHTAFKRLCSNQRLSSYKLNDLDVCDFYDELNKTLNAFDSYGVLLFDESRECNVRPRSQVTTDSDEIDESVSQYGEVRRNDEYMRLRNAPEMPPLEAIRESDILNQLVEDFANEDLPLRDSNTWIRYANLLVLLSVSSPYEMLYFHYDELVCEHMKRLPQREVWKQFYLPVSFTLESVVHPVAKRNFTGVGGKVVLPPAKRSRSATGSSPLSDMGDDELLEIKSTLASAIYKNINEDSRLGAPKNISAERLAEMKEVYATFKKQSDKVQAIARKELYHLYKLIRTASMKPRDRDLEMRDVISTVIASSVVLAYIRQCVVKKRLISALCNVKLLLLKEIADKHTVKRTPIALFLRDVCIACAEGKLAASSSAVKLDRLECIVELLVYIARFERQCVPIVSIFNSIMHQMDRSISRHFISMLLRYCGAPYGEQFVCHVLKLVENYLNLGTTGESGMLHSKEASVINNYLNPFLHECCQSWSDNSTVMSMTKRCESLLKAQGVPY
ncbi:uncharacterized protein BXIN_2278 [Babesia sp. Xinjiang]|uniref:uncharacterized protein n=1 Tax=Babesia sp. Xinjiang TaxID=462227 RepID=UPI000A220138|nr:uncharacterized protein BXIN_2278 [Babesia sp. Xinjiang]ORM40822.1 hypothetical protein BXIN_2278 [Babesia sp. Xinjiang]